MAMNREDWPPMSKPIPRSPNPPPPPPTKRSIELPADLHRALKSEATQRGIPINILLSELIQKQLESQDQKLFDNLTRLRNRYGDKWSDEERERIDRLIAKRKGEAFEIIRMELCGRDSNILFVRFDVRDKMAWGWFNNLEEFSHFADKAQTLKAEWTRLASQCK